MAKHIYECEACKVTEEVVEPAGRVSRVHCAMCGVRMRLVAGRTGTPVLREGRGGFYKPSKRE